MDFKEVPKNVRPAYAWFWNSNITKEGIDARIDEMIECGIGAFYVIAEPDNWFPDCRATHLYPKYLSDEYIDLLFYAFEKAEEKGIYTNGIFVGTRWIPVTAKSGDYEILY